MFAPIAFAIFAAKIGVPGLKVQDAKPYQGDFKSFFTRNDLKLRRAATGDDYGEPASIALLRDSGNDGYRANFAIVYAQRSSGDQDISLRSSLEVNLANKESDAERNLRYRLGYRYAQEPADVRAFGLILNANAKYEADQEFSSQQATLELTASAISEGLRMGMGDTGDEVGFYWEPILGVDVGRILERGKINQDSKDVSNFFGNAKAYFIFPRKIGKNATYFWVQDTFYYRSNADGDKDRNLLAAGFALPVSENASLGITYKNGHASPTFERVNTFEINFGVKF